MPEINANMVREQNFYNTIAGAVGKTVAEAGAKAEALVDAQKAADQSNIDDAASFVVKLDKKGGLDKNPPLTRAQKKDGDMEKLIIPPDEIKDQAQNFQKNNPQFQSKQILDVLKALPGKIRDCKTPKDIADIVKKEFAGYPPALQAKVLDFLEATTRGSLQTLVRQAKEGFATSGVATKPTLDSGPEETARTPTKEDALTDINGEPLNSVTFVEQLMKTSSIADIKKDLDKMQHSIGVNIKKHEAVEALLINLGKEGQVTQDTRALLNLSGTILSKIEKQCLMKEINPPTISQEAFIKCTLSILAHPRISGEKVLSMMRSIVRVY